MSTRRCGRGSAALAVLLFLTGCSGADDDAGAQSTSAPATSAPAASSPAPDGSGATPSGAATRTAGDEDGEEPPEDATFPADTTADGGSAQAGATADAPGEMRVTGLRLSSQSGYDRLVVDLSTSGVPEWTVRYTERSGPGGGPVEVAGDAFLRIVLFTRAEPAGQGSSSVSASSGPIAQARTTGFFEGYEEVLAGVRGGEQPFRAFALTDPGRIVVDVRPAS